MFRARREGRESERVAYTPPLLATDPPPINELFAVDKVSPKKMLAIPEPIGSVVVAVPADYTRY